MKSIIIPDLHGDFDELCNILYYFDILKSLNTETISSIIRYNEYNKLDMNNKRIIQLGDILDSKSRSELSKCHELKYTDMLVFIFMCNLKKTFPDQVILIIGNHEFLNYNKIFTCVSEYSHRNLKEINYIQKSIDLYFQYYYFDKFNNLFIHSSLPDNIGSISMLNNYDIKLKSLYSINDLSIIYNKIFTRIIPSENLLNINGIKRIFMGHTPYTNITTYHDNRVYYCDVNISKSFPIRDIKYEIITIDNNNIITKHIINRFNIKHD